MKLFFLFWGKGKSLEAQTKMWWRCSLITKTEVQKTERKNSPKAHCWQKAQIRELFHGQILQNTGDVCRTNWHKRPSSEYWFNQGLERFHCDCIMTFCCHCRLSTQYSSLTDFLQRICQSSGAEGDRRFWRSVEGMDDHSKPRINMLIVHLHSYLLSDSILLSNCSSYIILDRSLLHFTLLTDFMSAWDQCSFSSFTPAPSILHTVWHYLAGSLCYNDKCSVEVTSQTTATLCWRSYNALTKRLQCFWWQVETQQHFNLCGSFTP